MPRSVVVFRLGDDVTGGYIEAALASFTTDNSVPSEGGSRPWPRCYARFMAVADTRPVVVYVEDDADTFKIAALRLKAKYRLIWAQNDVEAVDLISFHHRELFAVLMDIELRGSTLDGLDLVRLLKGHPLVRTQVAAFARRLPVLHAVPVIVLTAYSARYSEAEVHAVGAAHFVTKPIDFTRLNLALAQANIAAVMKRLEKAEPQREPGATDVVPPATPSRR